MHIDSSVCEKKIHSEASAVHTTSMYQSVEWLTANSIKLFSPLYSVVEITGLLSVHCRTTSNTL